MILDPVTGSQCRDCLTERKIRWNETYLHEQTKTKGFREVSIEVNMDSIHKHVVWSRFTHTHKLKRFSLCQYWSEHGNIHKQLTVSELKHVNINQKFRFSWCQYWSEHDNIHKHRKVSELNHVYTNKKGWFPRVSVLKWTWQHLQIWLHRISMYVSRPIRVRPTPHFRLYIYYSTWF